MQILLTNDDGIFAPGLAAIYRQLVKIGNVTVVAPADSQSGASHSITYTQPLVCERIEIEGQFSGFSVQGSPADCVKLAYMQLCQKPIELVVAGINSGANAGINVFYSGTVAAAMEAAFLQIPAVAMSLSRDETMDFDSAAGYCIDVLKKLMPVKKGEVININLPQLSKGKPKGIRAAAQSNKGFDEYYIRQSNEQGQTVFQLAGSDNHSASEPPDLTDTTSLAQGYITITSLKADMTDHKKMQKLKKIFNE